jgi:hypothetical protein
MYPYSRKIIPPAPFVSVEISKPSAGKKITRKITREAILDSGADITALPPSVIKKLRLKRISTGEIGGVTGTDIRPIYAANIQFHRTSFSYLYCYGIT